MRHAVGGGLAFEFVAGDQVPFVGLAVGALVALAVATALRHVRAGAVKAGGDLRGTAVIEDGAGIVGSSAGLVPVRRLPDGDRRRRAGLPGAPPRAGEVQGPAGPALIARRAYDTDRGQEGDPDRHRRSGPGAPRPRDRRRPCAGDRAPPVAGVAHRRLRLDIPVADAGLPVGAGHRQPPGRLAHPQHDLVPPRRAAVRRVRVVVRGHAGRGDAADGRRRARQLQPACTCRTPATTRVRDARGRRAGHRRGQLLRLPRPRAAPDHAAVGAQAGPAAGDRRRRLRAAPVLLRRAVRVRPHRRAPRTSAARSTATAGTSAAGWSPATGSTSCSSTCTRPTPPSIGRATCSARSSGPTRGIGADGRGGRRLDGVPRPVRRRRRRRPLPERSRARWPTPSAPPPTCGCSGRAAAPTPTSCDLALAASNRVAMAYLLPGAGLTGSRGRPHRLARHPAADVTMWREGDWRAVRREGGELRFRRGRRPPGRAGRPVVGGRRPRPARPGAYPNALERIDGRCAAAPPPATSIVSARAGVGVRRRRRPPPRRRRQPRLAARRGLARPADHGGLRRRSGPPGPAVDHRHEAAGRAAPAGRRGARGHSECDSARMRRTMKDARERGGRRPQGTCARACMSGCAGRTTGCS